MEKLFTITLLTLISVFEIVIMLMGRMIPTAAVLIALILLLVFMMVFRLGSRHFWRMMFLIYLLNILLIVYMILKTGFSWPMMLVLFMIFGGLFFAVIYSRGTARRKFRLREVSTSPSIMPEKNQESHAASLIENYIREFEEKEKAPEKQAYERQAAEKQQAYPKKASTVVKKKFSPGRFLASKQGKQYHRPRCEWAKKIRQENRLWFATSKEAEKKGYTRHSCLKK